MISLPKLNFKYNEFNNYIDSETMYIHYNKHHLSYINNINNIFNIIKFVPDEDNINIIKNLNIFPKKYILHIKNNLGGHINHSLFWKILGYSKNICNELNNYILKDFNTFDSFKNEFEKCAMNHFGSGWVWLIYNNNKLYITSTSNQDNPIMGKKYSKTIFGYPILCLDIWEHAYYLKYKNKKIDYIKSFWNIINWDYISNTFLNIINNFNK